MLCLAAAAGVLFSGGQDATIRAWRYDEGAAAFHCAAVLDAAAGGHASPVQALAPAGGVLFSGDWDGNIKVWELASGVCGQTLARAHDSVVMGALAWEGHLITASLDGSVRVWAPPEGVVPGVVIEAAPAYSHPPDGAGDI